MRWRRTARSRHLEDRRGAGAGRFGSGGGPLPLPTAGKVGVPALVVLLLALVFGGDVFGGGGSFDVGADYRGFPGVPEPRDGGGPAREADPDARLVDFVSFVLDDVQATWDDQFTRAGRTYEPARLVLFDAATPTACGAGTAEVGPFYCPLDETVYLDLGFFRQLRNRFEAPGDFAQAYVVAHEVGHHVQHLLGISDAVRQRQQAERSVANELSVALELQADCLAGVWAHGTYERELLERGDLEEGLTAAAAVGDDRIQRQAGRDVDPETWTHGSSQERARWFRAGFDSGEVDACDTFSR